MIQGSWKEHSHVSRMEQGRNLGGGVERNIGKTKRTKRTISTIRMMEQGQDTWRGFGLSCSGKSGSTGSTGMDPGRTGKGRERNSCLKYISKDSRVLQDKTCTHISVPCALNLIDAHAENDMAFP